MEEDDCSEFVKRCPQLEELVRDFGWAGLADHAAKGVLPPLNKLSVVSCFEAQDKDVAAVLDQIQPAIELGIVDSGFGSLSFSSLKRHLGTFQALDLRWCKDVTSPMLQEILSSRSRLLEIHGGRLLLEDIVGGKTWVCHSIKTLNVRIVADKGDNDLLVAFKSLLPTLPPGLYDQDPATLDINPEGRLLTLISWIQERLSI